MNPRYASVARRAGHRCEYCHAPEAIFNFPFEVEHVTPISQQGPDRDDNWALACRSCNLYKGDAVVKRDDANNIVVPLFHPRTQRWDDHFQVNVADGTIVGKDSVGRATVARLRMNSESQIRARLQWIRVGLYP